MIVRATGLGSPRNGMSPGGGYRRFGVADWNPAEGIHLDPEAVAPATRPMPRPWPGGRAGRMAAYAQARREGLSRAQAAERVGIASETALKYERAYQRGESS